MVCGSCIEDMRPLKGSICASGTEECCLPCWGCPSCGSVTYLHSEGEFDIWIEEYVEDIYVDPLDYIKK